MSNKKISKAISIVCIVCIISAYIFALCGCKNVEYKNDTNIDEELPEIIIGSDIHPPFNYIDSDGNPTGIDVELAIEAFKRIGYSAVFVNISWDNKQKLLDNHEIDCVWGSFSMNGREDEYRWAGPYMKSRIVVAVSTESRIYTLDDLLDKTVAVQASTKPEEIFLERTDSRIPQIRSLLAMRNRELTYPMLSKGYVDALAVNEVIINQYMKDYNIRFRILDEALLTVGLGVAFDKNDTRGIDKKLADVLIEMHADGTDINSFVGKKNIHIWLIELIVGFILVAVVAVFAIRKDLITAQRNLSDTAGYINDQCNSVTRLNLASETKSLMRIIESAQQIKQNIAYEKIINDDTGYILSEEFLKKNVEDCYLSAVMLLDKQGNLIAQYCTDGLGKEKLVDYIESNTLLDVADNDLKSYATRIDCQDGSYIDLAADGMADGEGIVVTYYHTSTEYVDDYSLSFAHILSGYYDSEEGTVVVTSGDKIISSSDENMVGDSVNEYDR